VKENFTAETQSMQRSESFIMKTFTLCPESVLSEFEGRLGGEISENPHLTLSP
jgi:hypothetical protein